MDGAETLLRYIAVPSLTVGLGGLVTLVIWAVRMNSSVQAAIGGLKKSVDHLDANVVNLTDAIRDERQERNHLAERVGKHDVRIENLDGRMAALERGTERRHQREST